MPRSVSPAAPVAPAAWVNSGQRELVEPGVDRGQEDAGQDLAGQVLLGQRLLDAGLGARVEHVTRQELAHVVGDLADGVETALVAERRRDLLGDAVEAVAAQLEREHQVLLGLVQVAGRVEPLSAAQQVLAGAAAGPELGRELGQRLGGFWSRSKNSAESWLDVPTSASRSRR